MIRQATPQDIPAIFDLLCIIWEDMELEPWRVLDLPHFRQMMLPYMERTDTKFSYRNLWVYEENNEILGALLGYEGSLEPRYDADLVQTFGQLPELADFALARESRDGEWYLDSIVVSPQARGKGIGQQFFAYLPELFEKTTIVGLNCDLGNPQARKLYDKMGFTKVDEVIFSGHTYEHLQKTIKK